MLLQICSKVKRIWFCGSVVATPFYGASNKKLFQNTWGHLSFFLALSIQNIAFASTKKMLQVPPELIVVNYFWKKLHHSSFTGSFLHFRKVLETITVPNIIEKYSAANRRQNFTNMLYCLIFAKDWKDYSWQFYIKFKLSHYLKLCFQNLKTYSHRPWAFCNTYGNKSPNYFSGQRYLPK